MLVIGLGNPGEKFKNTRHNAGFMALDLFKEKNDFPDFEVSKKYDSLMSERDNVLLVKPQTFMNESGRAVKKLFKKTDTLVVVNDDIDLILGKLKISKDSGAGGHKGVESIIQSIGTKDFIRIRIGICPEKGKPKGVEKFVIKNFTSEEKEIINSTADKASNALRSLIENGLEKTMNQYNG